MSNEPEFSLDWPHGWKIRNGSTEIVGIVGRMHNGMIAFETSNVNVTIRHPSGQYGGVENSALDIINKPAPKREWWVNVYSDGDVYLHGSREDADGCCDNAHVRVACVKITEGDGLEGGER